MGQSVELYVVSNVAILSHEEIGMFDSGILIQLEVHIDEQMSFRIWTLLVYGLLTMFVYVRRIFLNQSLETCFKLVLLNELTAKGFTLMQTHQHVKE